MNDELNYEARLFFRDVVQPKTLDFHGDSKELARDHAAYYLSCREDADVIHFRKKGNKRWIIISKNEQDHDAILEENKKMKEVIEDFTYYIKYVDRCTAAGTMPITYKQWTEIENGDEPAFITINSKS